MNSFYNQQIEIHQAASDNLKSKIALLATSRLAAMVAALVCCYLAVRNEAPALWYGTMSGVVVFFVLVRLHKSRKLELEFTTALLNINKEEIAYLETSVPQGPDGLLFAAENHFYTHDLDVFGPLSLFQHVNRSGTIIGRKALADNLKARSENDTITGRQQAVKELSGKPGWRQEFTARAILAKDNQKTVAKISEWSSQGTAASPVVNALRFILPGVILVLVAAYLLTGKILFVHFVTTTFIANLLVLGSQLKRMTAEISDVDNIHQTILNYSRLFQLIESEKFTSPHLVSIQQKLQNGDLRASTEIRRLSGIFANLESLQNGFGAIILNGFGLYHIHTFHKLLKWKRDHSAEFQKWLELIGETEVLNSFANLHFNNPQFCFPGINTGEKLEFTELGHPMINTAKRVTNSVSFSEQSFIVLTGSNMSGKSTFLRTLGVNMILANAGAPVCAEKATFRPMDLLVSMRLSDSLSDSESYFFAEVKRLKEIMDNLAEKPCFVLLDEILRGTNSDDKRTGTIGVIEKMVNRNVYGAIATHDLEVCETTSKHPENLTNKCFEVEIIDNELHFDYKLREGICRNKSATFLMSKMGVI